MSGSFTLLAIVNPATLALRSVISCAGLNGGATPQSIVQVT
jgi:hypothetical protein